MQKGFTLIELLVVIAIIGILAVLVIANFAGVRPKARDAQRKSDMRNLQTALDVYHNDRGSYPDPVTSGCATLTPCIDTSILSSQYIATVPLDPKTREKYGYDRSGSKHAYRLRAGLENEFDDDRAADGLIHRCGGNATNYDASWDYC